MKLLLKDYSLEAVNFKMSFIIGKVEIKATLKWAVYQIVTNDASLFEMFNQAFIRHLFVISNTVILIASFKV